MNQRVVVSLSAVALVAVAAGGAALAARSTGRSHTPKTITIQGADVGSSATTMAASASGAFLLRNPNVTFVLSGDLPALDSNRSAWRLPANPTADLGSIATLARLLGVDGDVTAVDGGWQVGDQSSGHSFFVGKAASLPWTYVNAPNVGDVCVPVTTLPAEGNVILTTLPPCAGPPPPVGVPTKDEALAKTGELFKTLGIDAGSFTVSVNASGWSADVQAMPKLDGVAAQGLMSSFSFGGEGKLQFANGYLRAPEKADSYPRIGTLKAFDLLKSGKSAIGGFTATESGGGIAAAVTTTVVGGETTTTSGGPDSTVFCTTVATNYCMAYDLAPGQPPPPKPNGICASAASASDVQATTVPPTTAVTDQPMSPSAITCGSIVCGYAPATTIPDTAPADATTAAPVPLCPEPTPPEPVTITITGVHETLLSLMGADGSMWLVPGYEFTSTDGGAWPVLAIDKSFVDQVAPTLPTPESVAAMGSSSAPSTTTPPSRQCVGSVSRSNDPPADLRLDLTTDSACAGPGGLQLAVTNTSATLCMSDVLANLSDGTKLRFVSQSGVGGERGNWEPQPANWEDAGIMDYPTGERRWPVLLPNLKPGRYTITIHASCADVPVDIATTFEVKSA